MKIFRNITIALLVVLFFATTGWGVKKWVGMIIQDCTFIEDDVTQTATIAELNTACDGITATAKELNSADRDKVTMFTDFNGELIDGTTAFLGTAGSGTGNAVAIAAGESGKLSITTASDDGNHAANGPLPSSFFPKCPSIQWYQKRNREYSPNVSAVNQKTFRRRQRQQERNASCCENNKSTYA